MATLTINTKQNFSYFYNDGIITRADLEKQVFETRNFKTGNWQMTQDSKLIQKMMLGQKKLPSQEKADQLFNELKKSMDEV